MPISTRLRDTSHYLSELEADRDYLIRVRAENDFGVSEPTEPLWLPRAKGMVERLLYPCSIPPDMTEQLLTGPPHRFDI